MEKSDHLTHGFSLREEGVPPWGIYGEKEFVPHKIPDSIEKHALDTK